MSEHQNRGRVALIAGAALALAVAGCTRTGAETTVASPRASTSRLSAVQPGASELRTVSYSIEYQGRQYAKTAHAYVPAGYRQGTATNVLYLMHGSGMDHDAFARTMQPQFDEWIAAGDMTPMLVVIPTYYPDDSFVVSDYSRDYPLNHFFATTEITTLMPVVERAFTTHAVDTTDEAFRDSRRHRAFGGYSMGGITTWDVLVAQPKYFAFFMPMAGDSWIGRTTGASDDAAVADTLASGLRDNGYRADDFRVIAMVGGADGTKSAMQPQLDELRGAHADLFDDQSLIYWENEGGGHGQESLEIETRHGMQYLFQ